MAESELYKKGTAIRSKLMGAKYAENMNKSVYDDPIMKKFGDYAREAVFGMLWDRPGLDLKTKALICVVSDTGSFTVPASTFAMMPSAANMAFVGLGRVAPMTTTVGGVMITVQATSFVTSGAITLTN